MYQNPIPQNGYPYAPQMPGYFNPMAAGMPPVGFTQTVSPAAVAQPVPHSAPAPAAPSQLEQSVNAWLKERDVDLSGFKNGITGLLDGLYEAAQQGLEAPAPAPVAPVPQSADVNWRDYEKYLTTNDRGEFEPIRNSPVPVPYDAVRQANEVLKQVQEFRYNPQGFLQANVGTLAEEKARQVFEEQMAAWQAKQAQENSFNAFVDRHSSWMYVDGKQGNGLTDAGKRFAESVGEMEQAGVGPERVLDFAWQRFQGTILKEALEAKQREMQQPRQPNGQFAPMTQQQLLPPIGNAVQPQFNQQFTPAPQQRINPSAYQAGRVQPAVHQPAQNTVPQSPVQTAAPQAVHQPAPPQQTFGQNIGLGAAQEPQHRSDSFASSVGDDNDDFPDVEDVMREVAVRHGIDMSHN